jgi:formylglycine-generating enzyme required for sulfatase activity
VDALFQALLDRAEGSGSLALKARAAGLLGAALQDLRPLNYRLPDEARYRVLLDEILGIFEKGPAAGIPLKDRVEAAEALGQAGDPRLKENNWVKIPGGTFLMGASRHKGKPGYDPEADDDEGPVREEMVGPFEIGRYPVTVEEFQAFVEDEQDGPTKELPEGWDEQVLHPNRPVVGVDWQMANAYCAWASKRFGGNIHLPGEKQWEFAARGTGGRKYPWGNDKPDASRANYREADIGEPTPVGLFPAGNTPDDVADMAGNVWEWTSSAYDKESKVVRGGDWYGVSRVLRAAGRSGYGPGSGDSSIGFRVVRE